MANTGMLVGAGAGAAAGTAVAPGVGTVGGALLGAGLGGMFGGVSSVGEWQGPTVDWSQADVERSGQRQAREGQLSYADMLRMRAMGGGPSTAQSQLQLATNQAQRDAASMAASARGGALQQQAAQQQAMNAGVQAQQTAAQQAATLKAQEQIAAQGQYGEALGQMRGQDLQAQQTEIGQAAKIGDLQNQAAQTRLQGQVANQQAEQKTSGGLMGMGGSLLGGLLSDERQKEGVRDATPELLAFLQDMADKARAYRYKEGTGQEPGVHYGVMAQDLERTKVGQTMVHDTPQGKVIDKDRALPTMMATVFELEAQLQDVSRKLAELRGGK